MTAEEAEGRLRALADGAVAEGMRRFFKTGPGQYGEGDRFLGIKATPLRQLARESASLPLDEVGKLLCSGFHEGRMLALLVLVRAFEKGEKPSKKAIYDLYLANTARVNNWDLVDASAPAIVGGFLAERDRRPLSRLARSTSLWERRIAIVATQHFIRRGDFADTLRLAGLLMEDREDLIHKAVGWMLREVGKRDQAVLEGFLTGHCRRMPRTMLRYAIERFAEPLRKQYLSGVVAPGEKKRHQEGPMAEPPVAVIGPALRGPKTSLRTVAAVFLRLGAISFGGPAAHVAMLEEEIVRRRGWLTHEQFLDLIGAANLIPGPNSTEVAIHVGHRVAGWPGLVVAGVCFILPAAVIVYVLAWAYVTFGMLPAVEGLLYGVKPVVIAVVVQALWNLGRSCVKSWPLAGLGLVAVVLAVAGVHELLILFGAGLLLASLKGLERRDRPGTDSLTVLAWPGLPLASAASAAGTPVGLWPLFLFFLKVGSVLFGSGYVLLAFLRADLVDRYGWLTEQQLLDAVAIGQVTPGPVFTTATFIGYLLVGPAGAAVATIGIFLPAFVFVAASVPLLPRLRQSVVAGAFLDGVNVASLALMAVVSWQLGRAAIVDVPTAVVAVASALLLYWRVNSAWLVLGGAAVGLLRAVVMSA